jgi:hypothetical protein
MNSDRTPVFDELRFELDLMHLLAGCETASAPESMGKNAAAHLASELTQLTSAVQ